MKLDIHEAIDFSSAITYEEGLSIVSLVRQISRENAVLVEIGSWKGYSTSIIATAIKELGGHLYCVDHWKGAEGSGLDNEARDKDIYGIFEHNMRVLELWDYITPMKIDSLSASLQFNSGSVEFLFLDADHRYKQFKQDLEAWMPKMKTGGIICGHDCERKYSEAYPELKERFDKSLDIDCDGNYHTGVIRGLFDYFGDDYSLIPRIWFKEIK